MTRVFTSRNCGRVVFALSLFLFCLIGLHAQNPIVTENALPGNPKSEWDISGAGDLSLQGFATDISVNKGGTIRFKIDSDGGAAYSIRIYRLGYYQGNGARLIINLGNFTGTNQPNPNTNTATGLVECSNWSESASWTVPTTAVSGLYIAKLTKTSNGGSSHIVFIVRDDAGNAPILFKTSDATWQAYNNYGGNSLYNGATSYPSGHATKVSYDRPFLTRNGGGGGGAMEDWFMNAEYPMIRFMERNGYHMSYSTDVDFERDATPITPAKHKILLSVGHDEYWSLAERTRFENARNAGVHLAFFSGNEVYWKTRWENNNRTLVCYKEGILGENVCGNKCDPTNAWTGLWREGGAYDAGRPENALTGQISWDLATGALVVPAAYKNLRFWRGTSVASQPDNGSVTMPNGTLGYEVDFEQYPEAYPSGRITLSSTIINGKTHKLSLYRHPSGALVFGAGTIQWSWGLDNIHDRGSAAPSTAMQQATVNLFADMGVQPGSLMSGLSAASASTDFTAPVVNITSPVNGANVANNAAVTVTGNASDAGGVLVGVEVSVDGGVTWQPATGTSNWSFTWTPNLPGPASIRVRGFDDSGNMGVPGASGSSSNINVTVGGAAPVCPCTIFLPTASPSVNLDYDGQPIEVGVKFQTTQNGYITALRFYKGSGNTGTHIGHLWSSTGNLLAEATFINESASGWQQVNLATPVQVFANTTYVASYFSSVGYYSSTNPYFSSPVVNGYLRGLANGEDGNNGVYVYTSSPAFPNNGYQSSNYWVDVVFDPAAVSDNVPPTISITSPAAGNVSGTVEVAASASDNVGVIGVQFKLNGVNLGVEDLSAPYSFSWNTTAYGNGPDTLTAVARDASGNTTTSTARIVNINNTVADVIAPTVAITGPAAGNVTGTVNITANASDNVGVVGVQFLLDGINLGAEDLVAPYSASWNTLTAGNGTHSLTARARDAAGNITTSTIVIVNVANSNLVAAYNFNAGSGTVLADLSGNNNNGTLVNGPTWNASGRYGGAIQFDGSNDLINIPDANTLDLTNGMTLEAWVRPSNLSGYKTIICKDRGTSGFSYVLSANNSALLSSSQRPTVRIYNGSTRTVNGTSKLATNTWTHVASTFDGSTLRLYINGVQVATLNTTASMTTSTNALRIGGSTVLGSEYFAGLIDEVRIYNRALSQSEIQTDMNTPVGADGTAPNVSIASPASGNVLGTVNISAIANDNVGVSGVQFLLNGANLGTEDLTAPYEFSWNTTTVANGNYTLSARARDAAGNQTTSTGVIVTVTNPVVDTTRPTVSITSPSAGSVNGNININANAADNIGVVGVQFFLNGNPLGAEDLVAPYTIAWNTTSSPNGNYTITARARDAAGNFANSTGVLVSVNNIPDTQAPVVTLTSPSSGTISGSVNVSANASDNVGVAGVQFLLNGNPLGSEITEAPFTYSWNTVTSPNGAYTITARARDAAGNQTTSTGVNVTISNTSNLIVAMPFNETSGTTALDISGNSHNGILNNTPGRSTGRYGQGIDFDGVNDYINIADHSNFTLDPAQSYTWSGWIRNNNYNQWSTVWSQTVDANNVFYIYAHSTPDLDAGPLTNGLSVFWWTNGGLQKLVAHSTNNVLTAGQWTHISLTYDASQPQNNRFSFYVNGVDVTDRSDVSSSGTLMTINPSSIRIGANEPYGENFNGSIDEIRFYRRLLSLTELQNDMNTPLVAGPDLTAPAVASITPANGAIGVPVNSTINVLFTEPINASTVTSANFEVRNNLNALVSGTVSYNAGTLTATFTPSASLTQSTEYSIRIKGGSSGIKDLAGNNLNGDVTSSFTSATPPPPPPNDGPGGPILVVSAASNPFSRYTVEILRAEGLNEFLAMDISQVNSTVLSNYDVVVLGEMPLSSANVTMFTNWVNAGGRLIAFKPDAQLNTLMGLTATGTPLDDQYLLVNTASGPGAGIVNQTIQYHGSANRYNLNGATTIATLYSSATTATTSPAISMRNVGSNGGVAVAFAFDLARSIVYTRQGNPAQAGTETDGQSPMRPNDLFYPNYVDLNKVAIPQADEQQRLLANIIIQTNLAKKPLPRFWYLPKNYKAAVIFALDDHGTTTGTVDIFNKMLANSAPGCSVQAWECARATSWYYLGIPFTNTQAVNFHSQGFEVGKHVENGCVNFNATNLNAAYTTQLQDFRAQYPGVPAQATHRFHCIVWSDWVTQAKVGLTHGLRFNMDYYYWPSTWVNGRPGLFTGSGLPMRYADLDGSLIDVYQSPSQIVNENGINYTIGTTALLDNALGPQGYYGMFGAHDDYRDVAFSDEVIAAAKARNVPLITAQQALTWTDGRNNSNFGSLTWNGNTLSFTITQAAGANFLKAMLPASTGPNSLISITRNGTPIPFTLETIKGMSYAFFDATTGSFAANYSIDLTPPTVISTLPAAGANEVAVNSPVSATFNEAMNVATISTSTVELRNPANQVIPSSVSYNPSNNTVTLIPSSNLSNLTVYTGRIMGGTNGVKDLSGNALASTFTWTFTTTQGDVTAPLIVGTQPVNNSVNVSATTSVTVSFNETMNASTINGSTFELRNPANALVTSVVSYNPSTRTATLTPSSSLASLTQYSVTVKGLSMGVKDSAGNALAKDSVWRFTTDAGDITAPVITSVNPVNGSSNISTLTNATATFNEAMNASTINGGTAEIRDPSNNLIAASVTYDAGTRTVTITPVSILASGTTFTARIVGGSSGVKDIAGNALASNYTWTFTTAVGDVTAPLVTSRTPETGSQNVPTSVSIQAVFNEAMNASTINGTTVELRDPLNAVVSAVVTFNTGNNTITLTPNAALAFDATYAVTIKSGAQGVKDLAGNALAQDHTWNFSTMTAPSGTISIFSPTSTPANLANDGVGVEVGMKFRSSQNGQILGLRYYKGSNFTTGTRVGHLWTSTGSLIASATFVNETASGWQEVLFATPVGIAANTTYVVSYHSSDGHYTVTNPYFTSAAVNGPLRGLVYGEDGPNGMYLYTPTAAFPTSSYGSSNYWVDVVFSQGGFVPRMSQPAITTTTKPVTTRPLITEEVYLGKLTVKVQPNPGRDVFNLKIQSSDKQPVTIRIFDAVGHLIDTRQKVSSNSTVRVGQGWRTGTYMAEITQGEERRVVKLIKVD